MRTLIAITLGGHYQDAIIESTGVVKKEGGQIIWHNEQDSIATFKETAHTVSMYLPQKGNKFIQIKMNASDIKKLYEKIQEIEKAEYNEFFD